MSIFKPSHFPYHNTFLCPLHVIRFKYDIYVLIEFNLQFSIVCMQYVIYTRLQARLVVTILYVTGMLISIMLVVPSRL